MTRADPRLDCARRPRLHHSIALRRGEGSSVAVGQDGRPRFHRPWRLVRIALWLLVLGTQIIVGLGLGDDLPVRWGELATVAERHAHDAAAMSVIRG